MLKTALTLTDEQLERMTRYVRGRMEAIDQARSQGWIEDRERFEREWDDDFSHRAWTSGVFARSNESLNMIGTGVDYIRSRLIEELFGSQHWFAVEPRLPDGADLALVEQVRGHLGWKLGAGQIDFQSVAREMVTQACKLGECVTKISYQTEEETFERIASVLWDERTDAPVLTPDGEFVFEDGPAEALSAALMVPLDFVAEWHPGDPISREDLPAGFSWKEQIVSQRVVRSAGAKAVPLHTKEFYCPLNAPSVQEADFVAHLTSMRLSQLCGYLGVSLEQAPGEESGVENNLVNTLRRIRAGGGVEPEAESQKPMRRDGEGDEIPTPGEDPELRVAETYFTIDARGDGRPCRVFMMIAYDYDLPLVWDYIANVTPDGRYPFEAVTVNKEPHRWYGRSWFKKYEHYQRLIDKLTNQVLYRNDLAANPVKFRRKEAVVQWQDDQPFEISPDQVLDLNDGYTAQDALQTTTIPDLDEQTKFLLETVISTWRIRAGVSTVTQGSIGGLPSERTATGIAQVEETGRTLFEPVLVEVRRGVQSVLQSIVTCEYACMDEDERFPYMEGGVRSFGLLSRERARGLDLEASLVLPGEGEDADGAETAVEYFKDFLAVPDAYKAVAAPLYARLYARLKVENGGQYFQRVLEIAGLAEGGRAC